MKSDSDWIRFWKIWVRIWFWENWVRIRFWEIWFVIWFLVKIWWRLFKVCKRDIVIMHQFNCFSLWIFDSYCLHCYFSMICHLLTNLVCCISALIEVQDHTFSLASSANRLFLKLEIAPRTASDSCQLHANWKNCTAFNQDHLWLYVPTIHCGSRRP